MAQQQQQHKAGQCLPLPLPIDPRKAEALNKLSALSIESLETLVELSKKPNIESLLQKNKNFILKWL